MKLVLDTNILLGLIREATTVKQDQKLSPLLRNGSDHIVPSVVIGEILSISTRNNWGTRRLDVFDDIKSQFIITDINYEDILRRYAEIDAYSQGKLAGRPLGVSARNMGKNDLWIAATTSVLGATLLTTDRDFAHLDGVYLDVALVERQ